MNEELYYVISLKHTRRNDLYITAWASADQGYRWALSLAGRYSRTRILAHPGYYNSGCSNIAVPCFVLNAIAVAPIPRHHDGDTGPCVPNTRASWDQILVNIIQPPGSQPNPEFKGARRRKESAQW